MSELIAFIGVGNMGNPMAEKLIKAKKKVRVFDVSKEMIDKAKEKKFDVADSIENLLSSSPKKINNNATCRKTFKRSLFR
ncbi:MAG: hypothetical protein CM1200mP13_16870 [Candidatus Pelagibacterales bacterium]|nr:MAG: hypothetical protein CM1200mP13_16870 [Pelagibacterales bacterium]